MLNFDNFIASLTYMWQGMLCIFVVIGAIMLSVYIMGAISSKAAEKKKLREAESQNDTANGQ